MTARNATSVEVVGPHLTFKGRKAPPPIRHDDVRYVEMYKIDQMTMDLICCDIEVGPPSEPRIYTLHDDLIGWSDAMRWLEALPDFRLDWRGVVVQPPFAENRTVVFPRR